MLKQSGRHRGDLSVSVEDDGVGMSAERLAALLTGAKDGGVALFNIDQRLKQLYGKRLDIRSAVGEGTRASFTIPGEGEVYLDQSDTG